MSLYFFNAKFIFFRIYIFREVRYMQQLSELWIIFRVQVLMIVIAAVVGG